MNNLLYKEFKLALHPSAYLFLPMAAMLLIPSYPYFVAFFYQTLGIFFIFLNGNTTNDLFFTALLPIRKKDSVAARFATVIILELAQIILAVPFAFLRHRINPTENFAGMDANPVLFGLVLVMFAIFNVVFLPGFYKTGYKTGLPFLIACAAMLLFVGAAEAAIQFTPDLKRTLDTVSSTYLPQQLAVLAFGVVGYGLLTAAAFAMSVRRFDRLDL